MAVGKIFQLWFLTNCDFYQVWMYTNWGWPYFYWSIQTNCCIMQTNDFEPWYGARMKSMACCQTTITQWCMANLFNKNWNKNFRKRQIWLNHLMYLDTTMFAMCLLHPKQGTKSETELSGNSRSEIQKKSKRIYLMKLRILKLFLNFNSDESLISTTKKYVQFRTLIQSDNRNIRVFAASLV